MAVEREDMIYASHPRRDGETLGKTLYENVKISKQRKHRSVVLVMCGKTLTQRLRNDSNKWAECLSVHTRL